jgi:REP element-mobilizing transposase RayT
MLTVRSACRCVRRAYLCGDDKVTGKNFDHRKQWMVDRLKCLAEIFTIDVCAYAVMSNHYHLVLHINAEQTVDWTEQEVIKRWSKVFGVPLIVSRYLRGEAGKAESKKAQAVIELWRQRLSDLSWFMRCLNECLAREANKEDNCKGRFWEGRFKSQALLDEAALLTCMAYVDLNPIRAGISQTPETSDFTTIQSRIRQWHHAHKQLSKQKPAGTAPVPRLFPFRGPDRINVPTGIPFSFTDYLELVDWTGRAVREDKRGHIPANLPPILERLNIQPDIYLRYMRRQEQGFVHVMGRVDTLREVADALGQKFKKGMGLAAKLFPQPV